MQVQNPNKCDLCYGYGKNRQVYMNPKCGHKYCKQCLLNRHVPDENKIKCFVRNCTFTINVDEMDDYFVQLQLQQFEQIETEPNDMINIQEKKANEIKYNDYNTSMKNKEYAPQSQIYDKKINLTSEIKKQKQSDTTDYCGSCFMHFVDKIEQKKKCSCRIHLLCFACTYKQILENRNYNYNYYNNYNNQTNECQICYRWPRSY